MKTYKSLVLLLVLSTLLVQACGPDTQAAIATGIAQTQRISALETAAAGGGGGAPAEEGQPSDTPGPSVAFVSVTTDTHCRSGPRLDYSLLTTINVGQQVEVLKTFSNDYAVVKNPNSSGDCWLFLKFANTTDFSAFALPTATLPPTPTAINTATATYTPTATYPEYWEGAWTSQATNSPGVFCSMTLAESDNSITGTFECPNVTGTVSGTLSTDHRHVNGEYVVRQTTPPDTENGSFEWQLVANNIANNQFIGHFNVDNFGGGWCGWRAGASIPSPCQWP